MTDWHRTPPVPHRPARRIRCRVCGHATRSLTSAIAHALVAHAFWTPADAWHRPKERT